MKKIIENFKYPDLTQSHVKYGNIFLTGEILREDGDWRNYLTVKDAQNKNGIETSACYIYAQLHAIETLEEETFGELDNDYSARFNALLSNGTMDGGDPVLAGDSFRHDGLVNELVMPFDKVSNWSEFHSFKGVDEEEVRAKGKEYLNKKDLSFGVVVQREYPLETKYTLLKQALKRSPIAISVWGVKDDKEMYMPKPQGVYDTHLLLLTYIDENNVCYVRDTYEPFDTTLPANYNMDFGMGWRVIKRLTPEQNDVQLTVLQVLFKKGLLAFFAKFLEIFTKNPLPASPNLPLEEKKEEPAVVTPPKKTNREKLYEEALKWLGKDSSPLNKAPANLACAESVNTIYKNVFGKFICDKNPLSTYWTWYEMKKSKDKFDVVLESKEGDILVYPTGLNSPDNPIRNGHIFICGKDDILMSNNSLTGKWDTHYTLKTADERYKIQGGYPRVIFRVL